MQIFSTSLCVTWRIRVDFHEIHIGCMISILRRSTYLGLSTVLVVWIVLILSIKWFFLLIQPRVRFTLTRLKRCNHWLWNSSIFVRRSDCHETHLLLHRINAHWIFLLLTDSWHIIWLIFVHAYLVKSLVDIRPHAAHLLVCWLVYWIVLWHSTFHLGLITRDQLRASQLGLASLTHLRVRLVHLLGTKTGISIYECASGVCVWWAVVIVVLVFVYGSTDLGNLRELGPLIADLAIVTCPKIFSCNIVTSSCATLARGKIVISSNKTATALIMLSVYGKVILVLNIQVLGFRYLWIIVLLFLSWVKTITLISKDWPTFRRIRIVIHMSIRLRVVQGLLIVVSLCLQHSATLHSFSLPWLWLTQLVFVQDTARLHVTIHVVRRRLGHVSWLDEAWVLGWGCEYSTLEEGFV